MTTRSAGRRSPGRSSSAGHATSVEDAFQRLVGRGCPAYVPRSGLGPVGAIEAIRAAGGLAALAHFREALAHRDLLRELIDAGLRGLEVHYRSFNRPTTEAMAQVATEEGLLPTGGSDYHGDTGTYAESHARLWVPPEVGAALTRGAGIERERLGMATFVLIPGAGGLAWEWHRLGPELEARGHAAVPIDLPRRRRRVGARRVRRLDRQIDRRPNRRRARRPVVRRVHGTAGLRTGPRRPDRLPERDDPEAGRDVRRVVVEHRPGARAAGVRPTARPHPADLDDDRVVYYHDLPDELVEEALQLDADSSRARRSVSRGPSIACPTFRSG